MALSPEPITIAIVEDDPDIADLLNSYLRKEGYRSIIAPDMERAREIISTMNPRLVLLDLGLPGGGDGLDILREIRIKGEVAVMVITARDSELDRIVGLELGADDYVTKPFSPREVVARTKAILRRMNGPKQTDAQKVVLGQITIDPEQRRVEVNGKEIQTTVKEFDLLYYLATNRRNALSRDQILEAVWGIEWFGDERTIDVHVRQLRKKLGSSLELTTLWGVGYRLD